MGDFGALNSSICFVLKRTKETKGVALEELPEKYNSKRGARTLCAVKLSAACPAVQAVGRPNVGAVRRSGSQERLRTPHRSPASLSEPGPHVCPTFRGKQCCMDTSSCLLFLLDKSVDLSFCSVFMFRRLGDLS